MHNSQYELTSIAKHIYSSKIDRYTSQEKPKYKAKLS